MITAKRILSTAALALTGIAFVVMAAWLLIGDATLIAWLAQRAQSAAGVEISYREPFALTRTLSPTLTLGDLSVAVPEEAVEVRSSSLELQISLPRLLLGQLHIKRLWLGDTRIELADAEPPDTGRGTASTQRPVVVPELPVLHDLQIASLRLVDGQQELRLPSLGIDEVTLAINPATAALDFSARLDVAAAAVAIEASVPEFREALQAGRLAFIASAQGGAASLDAHGTLHIGEPEARLDGEVVLTVDDLHQFPTGLPAPGIPGRATARARFAGPPGQLVVSGITAHWQGPGRSVADVTGSIADLDDLVGMHLEVTGQLDESPWLTVVLPETLGTIRQATLHAHISGDAPRLAIGDFSLTARDSQDLDLSLQGGLDLVLVEGAATPENIHLDLAFSAPTTRAARALIFEDVPEFGAIRGSANVVAATGDPAIENIQVTARDPAGIEVDISGRIAAFPLHPDRPNSGYDLDAGIRATEASPLLVRLDLEGFPAAALDSSFRIEGDTRALRLEQISLKIGAGQALHGSAEGLLHFRDWGESDPIQRIDLSLQAGNRDTRSLEKMLGTALPKLGALTASARLQTVDNRHRISEFRVQTAKGAPVKLSLSGEADHVILLPAPAIEGISLVANAAAADTRRLNDLFDLQETIPSIGPAKGAAKLTGNDRQISITDVALTVGTADIVLVEVNGQLGTLAAGNHWRLEKADLGMTASATGSKALLKALGYPAPELGPLAASARIRSQDRMLGLEGGKIVIGEAGDPVIEGRGFIGDLLGAGKTRWDVELELEQHQLAALADREKLRDMAPLRGTLVVSNEDGSLGIDTLSLKSSGSERLSLDVSGQYGDFREPGSLSLTGALRASDMQTLGAFAGRDWPALGPVMLDTRIGRSGEGIVLDARLKVDKLELEADIAGSPGGKPLQLKGNIKARNAYIPQFAATASENIRQKRTAREHLFSRDPIDFGWLHKVNLDLGIDIESFDPELARAESARARLRLDSGRLALTPVTIRYPRGQLDLEMQIEDGDKTGVSLRAHGEDIDPRHALYLEKKNTKQDAELDIDIRLEMVGASVHELVAGSNGEVIMRLEHGAIRRDLIDLVFADIVGWTLRVPGQKYYDIECGVADYTVEQGVVTTRALLLDARQFAITGEGTLDLGQEQIDYVFLPREKSRLLGQAEPVKVSGSLMDPTVKAIPWKSAASSYGTLLFGPYIFAGATATKFLGDIFRKDARESPCEQYEEMRKGRAEAVP